LLQSEGRCGGRLTYIPFLNILKDWLEGVSEDKTELDFKAVRYYHEIRRRKDGI
jgi:hypothetical protein